MTPPDTRKLAQTGDAIYYSRMKIKFQVFLIILQIICKSSHYKSTANVQNGTGNERRLLRGKEQSRLSDLLRRTRATQRRFLANGTNGLPIQHAIHIGIDKASGRIWNTGKTEEWRDFAGSYGIQTEFGKRAVKSIKGDFDTVVGLPLKLLRKMLKDIGVNIDKEKESD